MIYNWVLVFIIFLLSSCQGYTNTSTTYADTLIIKDTIIKDLVMINTENFDIESFKKNVGNNNSILEHTIDDTIRVRDRYIEKVESIDSTWVIFPYMDCYERTIFYPDNFTERYYYFNNGSIKEYEKFFSQGVETGIWYKFNLPGSVIERVNKDEGYAFSLDDILKFGLAKGVNFHKRGVVERGFNSEYNKNVWSFQHIIKNEKTGERLRDLYVLDGQTGEVLSYIREPAPIRI